MVLLKVMRACGSYRAMCDIHNVLGDSVSLISAPSLSCEIVLDGDETT